MLGFSAGLRALGIAAIVAASTAAVTAPTAVAGTSISTTTAAARVVQVAELQRGKRYAYGAAGPLAFDCSGLVLYAYRQAGVSARLGGGHSGYGMLLWARAHHLFGTTNPQVGDVVIYGNGAHVGIYIGGGRVISALNPSQGIRITGLHALSNSVTGFIHTRLSNAKLVVSAALHVGTTRHAARTVTTTVSANLRSGASTSARIVVVAKPGTVLALLGHVTEYGVRWDHVAYGRQYAWVRANLVH